MIRNMHTKGTFLIDFKYKMLTIYLGLSGSTSFHCIGFAGTGLAISKNCAIIALKDLMYYW